MTTDLILGTAGHIDHGKTSLIRSLTGVETDRLPEERRRGITIELGFAQLTLGEFRLGIVDVPGHERFVRNMLAGATGMDMALLVVAADDSVKPQTREHLEILRLLNLRAGVIAITKADLVEPDWIALVEEEVRELVSDSFLAAAPIVRTSTATGAGLDELRERLAETARMAATPSRLKRIDGPFRMAIDRAFTIAGHGTVVTGSVGNGRVRVGDELLIEPGATKVRVRGVQNHDLVVDEVHRGQRAAINLAGIRHEALERGQELCSSGHLRSSRLVTAQIHLLEHAGRGLKDRSRVRVHLGTAELLAVARLLGQSRLEAGTSGPVQLFLSAPAVAVWGQPLVIRSESPVVTVGGGRVLDPNAEKIRKCDDEMLEWIARYGAEDTTVRSSAALFFTGLRDWNPADLPRTAGVEDVESACGQLLESGDLLEIVLTPTRTFRLHKRVFERLCDRLETALRKLHERFPLRTYIDRSLLINGFRYLADETVLLHALRTMQAKKRVRLTERGVGLVGQGPKLSQNERKMLAQLIEMFREAGIQSPTVQQCQQQLPYNNDSISQLLSLAAENGDLAKIAADYYVHSDVEQAVRDSLKAALDTSDGLTISRIREILDTSRKYAVPFCEYLDRIGFTERRGDMRYLAELPES